MDTTNATPSELLRTAMRSRHLATRIRAMRALEAVLEREQQQAAAEMRLHGATWQEIGDEFGVSRQGAWERFHTAAAVDALRATRR